MLITKLSNIMYAVTRGLTLRESHTPPQTTSSNPTTNHPLESSRSSSSTRPDQTQPGTRTEHLSLCGTTRPPYPHSHSHHLFPPSPAQHSPGAMQFFREFVLVLLGQNGMRSGGGGGDGGTLLQWIFGVRWWVQEYKKTTIKRRPTTQHIPIQARRNVGMLGITTTNRTNRAGVSIETCQHESDSRHWVYLLGIVHNRAERMPSVKG